MIDNESVLAGPPPTAWAQRPRPSAGLWPKATGLRRRLLVGSALLVADVLAALIALALAAVLTDVLFGKSAMQGATALAALLTPVVFLQFGLYSGVGPSPVERLRLRILGVCLCSVAALIAHIAGSDGLSAARVVSTLTSAGLLVIAGYYGEIVTRSILIKCGLWGAPVLLVGGGSASQRLAEILLANLAWGLRPVGFIETSLDGQPPQNSPFISRDIHIHAPHAEVVLFPSMEHLASSNLLDDGPLPYARVLVAQNTREIQSLWLNTRALGGTVAMEIKRDLYLKRNLCLKRTIDCLVAIPIGVLAAPLILVLAFAIKCIDPGPAFYFQHRVGLNGRPIRVVKLRTMYNDAEERLKQHLAHDPAARAEWARYYKLSNDLRILPFVGSFIRRTSLDEIPQLFNIIVGDMSLVGPRPFPEYHMAAFEGEFRALRTSVPPGLTGLWQVSVRSDGDLSAQQALDTYYIRNWSLWLDLYILLHTAVAIVSAKGAK